MADDSTVVTSPGFTPEPIPDSIADTELNGFNPAEESTDSEQVEVNQDETEQAQPADEAAESGEPTEEVAEATEEPVAPPTEQPKQPEEMTGVERRLAEKARRDYIAEQRQQIREAEQVSDPEDQARRLEILEAKQYIDTVERNRQSVAQEVAQAQELPFFKSGTPQAQLLFQQSLENFANAYGVVDPESGEWIAAQDRNGNDVHLYPYLQQQAAIYERALADAKAEATVTAQKSEAKMRAKAVNPSNPGKVTSSGDELDDLLDRIGNVSLN